MTHGHGTYAPPQATEQEDADSAPEMLNRSVLRALKLLTEVGKRPEGGTVTELAAATELARPTTFRLLQTLDHAGFLVRADSVYSLGWQVARLGRLADPHGGILSRVQVTLDSLVAEVNETVAYSVVTGPTKFDLIAEAQSSHFITPSQGYMGYQLPLHASASGKVLLADLPEEEALVLLPEELEKFTRFTITDRQFLIQQLAEIRAVGYATLDSELEEGLYGLAVGVRDDAENLIGVLAVSGLDQRMKAASPYSYVDKLKQAATEISEALTRVI